MNKEDVLDETYRKAGKMDSESFSPHLDPVHTDLLKIIRDYLLEGSQSMKNIKLELYKLNVYGMHSLYSFTLSRYYVAIQVKGRFSSLTSILRGARRCLARS